MPGELQISPSRALRPPPPAPRQETTAPLPPGPGPATSEWWSGSRWQDTRPRRADHGVADPHTVLSAAHGQDQPEGCASLGRGGRACCCEHSGMPGICHGHGSAIAGRQQTGRKYSSRKSTKPFIPQEVATLDRRSRLKSQNGSVVVNSVHTVENQILCFQNFIKQLLWYFEAQMMLLKTKWPWNLLHTEVSTRHPGRQAGPPSPAGRGGQAPGRGAGLSQAGRGSCG